MNHLSIFVSKSGRFFKVSSGFFLKRAWVLTNGCIHEPSIFHCVSRSNPRSRFKKLFRFYSRSSVEKSRPDVTGGRTPTRDCLAILSRSFPYPRFFYTTFHPRFISTHSHHSLAIPNLLIGWPTARIPLAAAKFELRPAKVLWFSPLSLVPRGLSLYSCATCSLLVFADVFEAREISVTPTDVCTAAVKAL